MSARHRILQRLREAHRPTSWPAVKAEKSKALAAPALLRQFTDAITAAHAEVIMSQSSDWVRQLESLALARGWRRWLVSETHPYGQVLAQSMQANEAFKLTRFNAVVENIGVNLFEEVDAAITSVKALIADTGSLVLWPNTAEPRQMSLVPPVHVAIAKASEIYASFAELMYKQNWSETGLPTNALLISGPSKTADIQQTLAYGAHGPKVLIVFVLEDE